MLQPRGIPCSSSWISWAGGVHDHPPGLGHSGGQQRPTGPEHQTDRDWLRRSPLTSSDSGTALVPVHAGCNDPGRLQMHQKDWSDCCGVVNMIGQRVLLCGVVAADWCAENGVWMSMTTIYISQAVFCSRAKRTLFHLFFLFPF